MTASIFAASIAWRHLEPEHDGCMKQLVQHPQVEFYYPKYGDALLCRSRSQVATRFLLESDCDVLLTVDSDITFEVEDAIAICEQAMENDIVAGLYTTRSRGVTCKPTSIWERGQEVAFANDPTLAPLLWASGGFMAVHRRVFEHLKELMPHCHEDEVYSFYPFYQPFYVKNDLGKWIYLSEDYALCQRARDAGFGCWLNPAVRLQHWGVAPFRLEDMAVKEPPTMEMRLTRTADGGYDREFPDWENAKPKDTGLVSANGSALSLVK